jgi:ubiquinone/menaquinone biosynthesis C-methylase UbiE
MDALPVPSLAPAFQDSQIHSAWESVYRREPLLHAFYEQLRQRIIQQLRLRQDDLVFDAGCGTGEHTLRFAEMGYRCLGIDISQPVLDRAADRALARGLQSRVEFSRHCLEDLPFEDASVDAVHCRGVLMHVPGWERALTELCRVLKPGARIAISENNHRALEMALIRLVRRFKKGESQLVETAGGPEFWLDRAGEAPLTRVANIACLADRLAQHGVRVVKRFASEFWDVNRFPARLRAAATHFNRIWFALHLPAWPSMGNVLIGEKSRG